jgi:hypothetical protein
MMQGGPERPCDTPGGAALSPSPDPAAPEQGGEGGGRRCCPEKGGEGGALLPSPDPAAPRARTPAASGPPHLLHGKERAGGAFVGQALKLQGARTEGGEGGSSPDTAGSCCPGRRALSVRAGAQRSCLPAPTWLPAHSAAACQHPPGCRRTAQPPASTHLAVGLQAANQRVVLVLELKVLIERPQGVQVVKDLRSTAGQAVAPGARGRVQGPQGVQVVKDLRSTASHPQGAVGSLPGGRVPGAQPLPGGRAPGA